MNLFTTFLPTFLSAMAFLTSAALAGTPALEMNAANEYETGVRLAVSAKENVTGMNKTLALAGAGLRTKKVIINVKVYVAQFFAEKPEAMVRTEEGVMSSLNNMGTIALNLTFLRAVDAASIQTSFREGLNANDDENTDMKNDKDIEKFLSVVKNGKDAASGSSMTLVGYKKDDTTDVLVYEDAAGNRTEIAGKTGFVSKIFSIWFKESADSGLETLKARLLKTPVVTAAAK